MSLCHEAFPSKKILNQFPKIPSPTNYVQEMYMSFLLMSGVILLAITIGSAADMVQNANRRSIELQMKCDYAKSYLKQKKITGELETRIKSYLDYLWISNDDNQTEVLNNLPFILRKEIAMNVHIDTLKRKIQIFYTYKVLINKKYFLKYKGVHIFQDCEPGLLEELVTTLKLQIYSPGDYVCRKGDVGHEV